MRIPGTLLLLLATVLPAQDVDLPQLENARPLVHPSARGQLRGLTAVLAVTAEEDGPVAGATAVVNYLARLMESAGAGVAVVGTPVRQEPLADLAAQSGAALVLEIGCVGEGMTWVGLPAAGEQRREAEVLQRSLADLLFGAKLCEHVESFEDDAPAVPTLRLWLVDPGSAPGAHREPTHELLRCVVAWWTMHGRAASELAKEHAAARPGERTDSVDPLWPLDRPPATDAEVAAFLTNWRRAGPVDGTQVWLDVTVTRTDKGWVLAGSTELPLFERAVRRALAGVGVEIARGRLRELPDHARLGCEPFGVVTAAAAQTWSRPGRATGLRRADPAGQGEETDLLQGEPVWLLDREAGSLLVHAASGYLGWVREDAVEPVSLERFRELLATDGGNPRGELVARRALARLGTPYLYGGRSATGIDCSGLVGTAWSSEEVFLPRDARTQILAGQLVATAQNRLPLEPGDLLFFASSTGRISHVGMSLGGMRFVHATPPEVTVGSLDPDDAFYTSVAERFVLAKRPGR